MSTFNNNVLYLRLKKLRGDKKQTEVAAALNMTQQTYSRYECGERTPDAPNLCIIADYYGVSTDYLLGRVDAPNHDDYEALSRAAGLSKDAIDILESFGSGWVVNQGHTCPPNYIADMFLRSPYFQIFALIAAMLVSSAHSYVDTVISACDDYLNHGGKPVSPSDYSDLLQNAQLNAFNLSKSFNDISEDTYAPLLKEVQAFCSRFDSVLMGDKSSQKLIKQAQRELSDIKSKFKKVMMEYGEHYPKSK